MGRALFSQLNGVKAPKGEVAWKRVGRQEVSLAGYVLGYKRRARLLEANAGRAE